MAGEAYDPERLPRISTGHSCKKLARGDIYYLQATAGTAERKENTQSTDLREAQDPVALVCPGRANDGRLAYSPGDLRAGPVLNTGRFLESQTILARRAKRGQKFVVIKLTTVKARYRGSVVLLESAAVRKVARPHISSFRGSAASRRT